MTKKCVKCGYEGESEKTKFNKQLCEFCAFFAPLEESNYLTYCKEKVPLEAIETYRKQNRLSGSRQKEGMEKKAEDGAVMSRPPFGYEIINNKLEPAENYRVVEEIFADFINTEWSLNRLSKKYGLSINGLKKILRNFTYLGKVKFAGLTHQGNHKPLVSATLFNHVQDKLERRGIK